MLKKIEEGDIIPESWQEIIEELYRDSFRKELGAFRSNYVFRGVGCKSYELATSLLRNCGNLSDELEISILRNFEKYSERDVKNADSIWDSIVIGQHHGLPTRLLDWTISPFVALHFSSDDLDKYNEDGAIWCVDVAKAHELIPDEFKRVLKDERAVTFSTKMLSQVCKNLIDFDKKSAEPFFIFLEPPSIDERIINQYALLSIASSPLIKLDDILIKYHNIYKRIIIKKDLKWEIRDKLDQANMNERVLYGGIDGLCMWLKRYYKPREGGLS